MTDPLADLSALIQSAMRDAAVHRAYLHALKTPVVGPDGSVPIVSDEDARAMVVAYIQASGVAKIKIDPPAEEQRGW